jgi:hypothetical protein
MLAVTLVQVAADTMARLQLDQVRFTFGADGELMLNAGHASVCEAAPGRHVQQVGDVAGDGI